MSKLVVAAVSLSFLLMAPVSVAQTDPPDPRKTDQRERRTDDEQEEKRWQFWLKLAAQNFENFFQATEGSAEEDVFAGVGEIGAGLRFNTSVPLRLYGSFDYTDYDEEGLDSSEGIRLGLRSDGRPHGFDIRAENLRDRPSFDIGDEFDRADIRTFGAEYWYRFGAWQASVEGSLQEQEIDLTPNRDSDFGSFGAAVRWRPSRMFSPEVGVLFGERDVDDDTQSYDQRDLFVQIRSSLTPVLYATVKYRMRERDYQNVDREDDRDQISASADWSLSDHWEVNFYGSWEDVDVNLECRDFDTALYLAGVTYRF